MKAQSLASAAGAGVMLAAGVSAEATFKVSSLCLFGLLYHHPLALWSVRPENRAPLCYAIYFYQDL